MISIRHTICSITFLCFLTTASFCQEHFIYDLSVENKFSIALHLYRQNDLKGALDIFNFLVQQQTVHQRTTAAYIMGGKTLMKLRQYNASIAMLQELLKMYPDTRYANEVRYNVGISKLMNLDYNAATSQLFACLEGTTDTILFNKAARLFEYILTDHLNIQQIQNIFNKSTEVNLKDLVGIILSEKVYQKGDLKYAKELVTKIGDSKRAGLYFERIQTLRDKLNNVKKVKICAVLPLMKNSSKDPIKIIAEDILDGISFALKELNNELKYNGVVSLIAYDDDQDTSVAKKKMQELSNQDDVIAVIGSVFSDITFSCALAAENYKIPLLSPKASANGIASVGSYIFQANPDFATRGKAMARYAVQNLGMHKFAILASDELAGSAQAESFASEINKLGGKIVVWETYSKGESDLSKQFLNIRRAGMNTEKYSPDNTSIRLTTVQGVFLPIANSNEIGVIASQMKYFNIDTEILGTNEWYDESQLESQKSYLGDVIFLTDTFVDEEDPTYSEFKKSYLSGMKKYPTKYAIMGCDIAKLILSKIVEGAITREEMATSLSTTKSYQGIQAKISFINGRVNSMMQICRYSNGEIRKIAEISVD